MHPEGVEVGIVCGFVFCGHEVDCVPAGTEEEELEDGVVEGFVEVPEEIKVPCYVDYKVEGL